LTLERDEFSKTSSTKKWGSLHWRADWRSAARPSGAPGAPCTVLVRFSTSTLGSALVRPSTPATSVIGAGWKGWASDCGWLLPIIPGDNYPWGWYMLVNINSKRLILVGFLLPQFSEWWITNNKKSQTELLDDLSTRPNRHTYHAKDFRSSCRVLEEELLVFISNTGTGPGFDYLPLEDGRWRHPIWILLEFFYQRKRPLSCGSKRAPLLPVENTAIDRSVPMIWQLILWRNWEGTLPPDSWKDDDPLSCRLHRMSTPACFLRASDQHMLWAQLLY
jgi:hypothetical protein